MTTRNPLVRISGKIVDLPAADTIGGAPAGSNGTDGIDGGAITIKYTFDTATADADPGGGKLRLNNATQNTATSIYADLLDTSGADWTTVLDTFDDSTNTTKGSIRLVKSGDATAFLTFNVTAVTTATGYRKITISNTASSASSPFANGDTILLCFDRTGDKGADGTSSTGLTLVEQHTASASAQLDFTLISSTYDTYVFELVQIQAATSAANLLLRVGTGGTPTYDTGSNYNWANAISNSAGGTAFTGSGGTTSIELAASMGNGATNSLGGTVKLYDPANTTFHKRFTNQIFYANSAGTFSQRSGGGSYATTTAVTAVRFFMSSGNIAAGTIRMYGLGK